MQAEIRGLAPGLWIWRVEHPDWSPDAEWEPAVTSTCVETGGEVAVLDALLPPDGAEAVRERLDARPPTLAVVLKPDHVRSVDEVVRRYGARAYGPSLFWPHDCPRDRARADRAGLPSSRRPRGALRRPRAERDAPLAPRAAHDRLRRSAHRARGRAARLGDAVARAAGAPGAPLAPRARSSA